MLDLHLDFSCNSSYFEEGSWPLMARSMCQDFISTIAQVLDAPVWPPRVMQDGLFAGCAVVLF